MEQTKQAEQTEPAKNRIEQALSDLVALVAINLAKCDDEVQTIEERRASLKVDLDNARKALAAVATKKRKVKKVKRIVKAVAKLNKFVKKEEVK